MNDDSGSVLSAQRWGLSESWVRSVGEGLRGLFARYRHHFKTRTRDGGRYAWDYLCGLLLLESGRNFANIARRLHGPKESGQNLQHFMSSSPWSAAAVLAQIQQDVLDIEELSDGALLIDESCEQRAGFASAGAQRQYNGRLGKVEMSQVGVFLGIHHGVFHCWLDAELFLPESWFDKASLRQRERAGVPHELGYESKTELAYWMLKRAAERGLPQRWVLFDSLYGRSATLRRRVDELDRLFIAQVPVNTKVWLKRPKSTRKSARRDGSLRVGTLGRAGTLSYQRLVLRDAERGELVAEFAMRRVWVKEDGRCCQRWLILRREEDASHSYYLSNAAADIDPEELARRSCWRYFIERANQDAKSEYGFDEFCAIKWRAWHHHLALTCLCSYFIATQRLSWKSQFDASSTLCDELHIQRLPTISPASIRLILRVLFPLPTFSLHDAILAVVNTLVARARSTASRLRAQHRSRPP